MLYTHVHAHTSHRILKSPAVPYTDIYSTDDVNTAEEGEDS